MSFNSLAGKAFSARSIKLCLVDNQRSSGVTVAWLRIVLIRIWIANVSHSTNRIYLYLSEDRAYSSSTSDASLIGLSLTRSPSWVLPTPSFRGSWKTLQQTNQTLGRIMWELVKTKSAVQELVVLVGHGCLSQKSFLWVITLHKIILVGDDALQNRSCGIVVPPQTRSCKEKKVNTKWKWDANENAKGENLFLLFLMNLERNKSKESRGRKSTKWS